MSRKLLVDLLVLYIFVLQSLNVEAPIKVPEWLKSSKSTNLKTAVETLCESWDSNLRDAEITTQQLNSKGVFQECLNNSKSTKKIQECAEAIAQKFTDDYSTYNLAYWAGKDTRDKLFTICNNCLGEFEKYKIDVPILEELMNMFA